MDTKKMRACAPLLPPPGDQVVIECLDEIERLRGEADATEYYCGCEHHRSGPDAIAHWDEDGCCLNCGVDVDPWTIRALQAEAEVERLRRESAEEFAMWFDSFDSGNLRWAVSGGMKEVLDDFRAALAEKEAPQ